MLSVALSGKSLSIDSMEVRKIGVGQRRPREFGVRVPAIFHPLSSRLRFTPALNFLNHMKGAVDSR